MRMRFQREGGEIDSSIAFVIVDDDVFKCDNTNIPLNPVRGLTRPPHTDIDMNL